MWQIPSNGSRGPATADASGRESAALRGRFALNGRQRVALPWQTLTAFVRISTNPRAWDRPLDPDDAAALVQDWLDADNAWVPDPGPTYAENFLGLVRKYQIRGSLVSDVQLAALAMDHGLPIYSADTDFARFSEIRWVNPIQPT